MCLVKRQFGVNHNLKGDCDRSQTIETTWGRGAAASRGVHTVCAWITCSPWSSCWAAVCTTAAAVCAPPLLTGAPAGMLHRIWRCAPAPSWRAASAYPGTCPGLPAGTTPISRYGRTWCEREETDGKRLCCCANVALIGQWGRAQVDPECFQKSFGFSSRFALKLKRKQTPKAFSGECCIN